LSFERWIVSGEETSTGTGKRSRCAARPFQVERGLRQHDVDALALDDLEHRVGEAGIGAGRDEWNASQRWRPTDRSLMSGADEPHMSLAVRPQALSASAAVPGAPDAERGRSRPSREVDPVRRELVEAAGSFSSSSIARIVSPIRRARDRPRSRGA
jgi:hypothetical protein